MNANKPRSNLDPVFRLPTPLLFAHRGGALEQPESTQRAFRHAKDKAQADVLELDIQITKDEDFQFVVWHGPKLDNVLIDGVPTNLDSRSESENDIREFSWKKLKDKAWVTILKNGQRDLSGVERADDTRLLLLEELMSLFPDSPLNIELKKESPWEQKHIKRLLVIVDADRKRRPIVVVSQTRLLLTWFREACRNAYPTGLSVSEALATTFRGSFPFVRPKDLTKRALQTSHSVLTSKNLVRKVHEANGAVHVFLNVRTVFSPPLDRAPETPTRDQLFALLARGIDGVMTDRPEWVRPFITEWKSLHP